MSTFVIERLSKIPTRKTREATRIQYPFSELREGYCFYVDDPSLFASARVAVSAYNRQHGTDLHATTDDTGRLCIWYAPKARLEPASASQSHSEPSVGSPARPATRYPTQFEYLDYLSRMNVGQSFVLKSEFAPVFPQLSEWTRTFNGNQFAVTITDNTMRVERIG